MRRALLAVLFAATPSVALAGSMHAPILGGTPTQIGDFPTVVAVEITTPQFVALCTGTLIHPQWVLTAAHCVDKAELQVASQAAVTAAIKVRFDVVQDPVFTGGTGGGRLIAAADTIPNPGFNGGNLGDNDIGLIKLAEPVDDRMVSRVNRSAAAAPVGVQVTLVGYGQDSTGSAGKEYSLANRSSTSCSVFGAGSDVNLLCFDQTDGKGQCQGDSGGPTFVMADGVQTVAGVTSFGDQNCAFFGADTRVDAEIAFVDQHVGPELKCVHDGICTMGCTGANRDLDCPACETDDQCAMDQICDAGGTCVPAPFTPGGLGAPCTADAECASGICASDGTDKKCSADCAPMGTDCPDGFDCLGTGGADGACWPAADGGGGGGGCAAGGDPSGMIVILGGLGLAFLARRRRR